VKGCWLSILNGKTKHLYGVEEKKILGRAMAQQWELWGGDRHNGYFGGRTKEKQRKKTGGGNLSFIPYALEEGKSLFVEGEKQMGLRESFSVPTTIQKFHLLEVRRKVPRSD